MKAIVLIKVQTGEVNAVVKDLRRLRSVAEANPAFGPYDAIAIVQTDNLRRLGKIVAGEIQPIPGVMQTVTCLMVEADLPVEDAQHAAKTGVFGIN